jgi:hypothetical protein
MGNKYLENKITQVQHRCNKKKLTKRTVTFAVVPHRKLIPAYEHLYNLKSSVSRMFKNCKTLVETFWHARTLDAATDNCRI